MRFLGNVAKGIHAVAPKASFLIPEYEYLKGGNRGDGTTTFHSDSDSGKVISALWEADISDWKYIHYNAKLADLTADETTAD